MYISTLPLPLELVYVTTYASPKTANATTTKSTPLMNIPFLSSLLLCRFKVNCDLSADSIVDVVGIDLDEDIITEKKE